MSVHDDGPPRWDKKPKPSAPSAPSTSTAVPATDEEPFPHAQHVRAHAEALLADYLTDHKTITSLDFKHALRRRCVELEPTPIISQEDCSRFLKRWFLDRGEKDGYAFREHPAVYPSGHEKAGEVKPGRTVYNEYYFAPGAREAEKEIENAFEKLAVEGKVPEGGVKAFFKRMWSKLR